MKLPSLSIRNYQFTLIMFFVLLAIGVASFFTMSRSEDPYMEPPHAAAIIIVPGMSVEDIETGICDDLEGRINGIEDVKHIDSLIEDGLLVIHIEFYPDSDMQEGESRLQSEVNEASKEFPPGVVETTVRAWNILYVKILQVSITGENYTLRDLWKYADKIKSEFQKTEGVHNVRIEGYPGEEVSVELIPEKLSQYNIPFTHIYAILQANNYNIPAGEIQIGKRKFDLRTSGQYESLREIGNTVIGALSGRPVYLKDVAQIEYRYSDPRYVARYKGEQALLITLEQQKDKNLLSINDNLKKKLDNIKKQLPPDLKTDIVFEQAESVRRSTNSFMNNLLQGVILVGLVVILMIGLRPSIVVMLAIPSSLIIAIGVINAMGYGLQQMTIAAMIISLGLLVDNAIVITENIQRFLDSGFNRYDAAHLGASQVGWAIVSATTTTVFAYIPMILMKDMSGDYIRSMPLGVAVILTCSLLIALTLSPMISYFSLKQIKEERRNLVQRKLFSFINGKYKPTLTWALVHPKISVIIAVSIFIIVLSLFPLIGVSFFPPSDKPQMFVNLRLPRGASLEWTEQVAIEAEKIVARQPEVIDFVTNIGDSNPPIFYNVGVGEQRKNYAQLMLQLDRKMRINDISRFAEKLRKEFEGFSAAKVEVKRFWTGPPSEAPIVVRILGNRHEILKKLSKEVADIVETVPGCINVNNPLDKPSIDMKLEIDRDKAMMFGVSLIDIDRAARLAVSGLEVGQYQDDHGDIYEILLHLPENEADRFADFSRIYVPSISGKQLTLSLFARIVMIPGYSVIQHRDLERAVSIYSDAVGRSVNEISKNIEERLNKMNFPTGYRFELGGEEESRGESFTSMAYATIIAILGIYAVLVLQFKSFVQPFIIYVSLPFALVGAILALLLTGYSFGFTAFIGIASLVGIVVNNAIILVDYANKIISEEGLPVREALIKAGTIRFRPILATTLTTIGGLLPLAVLGGEMWAPMSWVVIGGLLVSTMLTLIMVPVFYLIFGNRRLKSIKS